MRATDQASARDRGAVPAATDGTRERILAAAATTLSVRGCSETRLAEIASSVGVRTPALYYYFASRDELVAEVLQVGQQRVRQHVEERLAALPAGTSALDALCAAAEAHLHIELELSEFASAVTRNARHVPDAISQELRRESEAYHTVWRGLLRRAVDEGALRADLDPVIARMLIIGALNWAAEWWSHDRSIGELAETAASVIRHALSA